MRDNTDTCAGCRKFPLQAAAANGGRAQCEDFEREHGWKDGACVLFMRANDREARKRIVIQLMKAEKE